MSDFLFQHLLAQVDLSNKDGRSKLAALAVPLINQVPGETLRLYLRNTLGQKLGIVDSIQLEKILPALISEHKAKKKERLRSTPMRLLIALLVQNPELADKQITRILLSNPQVLYDLNLPGLALFLEIYQICANKSGITTGQLLEFWRGKKSKNP